MRLHIVAVLTHRCDTTIVTETVARVDFSARPFKLFTEAMVSAMEAGEKVEPVYTKSVIIATGATAKRMHIPGEETYWQAGISACAVCDGAAPIFRNKPLAGTYKSIILITAC